MRRALLVQLPVPGFLWPRLDANIPLAAGYLAAWARRSSPGWEVEILPWREADLLGDEALLSAILRREPDAVGLSLYLWNAERSLALAGRLSERGVTVVVGGPEVLADSQWLRAQGGFAAGVPGGGEAAFAACLRALGQELPLGSVPGLLLPGHGRPAGALPDPPEPGALPSPYLDGILGPYPDGSVWLETVRGCAYRCAYCRYGKDHRQPRPFAPGWLPEHLAWAVKAGAREVYLMDPSFNVRPDWAEVLQALEAGNPDRNLSFHTELVADALRPGDGARLARAGLRSCEVGLQSARPEVLAAVGRPWSRERWLAGVQELLAEGVSVTAGLIVGLPGDDPGGFRETLDFLRRDVPRALIQVFPLALLPGTDLRARAAELGLESSDKPPYAVTRTPGYSPRDLREAFELFEETTGLELDPLDEPDLEGCWDATDPRPPYLSGVRIEAAAVSGDWVDRVAPAAATSLTVWLRGWNEGLPAQLGRLARRLAHGVLTIVLEDEGPWPRGRLATLLAEVGTGDHYLDRSLGPLYGPGARVVPRLVVLVEDGDPGVPEAWVETVAEKAEVVWKIRGRKGWPERVAARIEEGAPVLVSEDVEGERLEALARRLGSAGRGVLFASGTAAALWRRLIGDEGFRAEGYRMELRG